ncbi:MAG: hypothetical protein HND51_02385 [Chloroflexi bacterium]|nr:hypothetical protein [Chloroflexota bacterium]
MTVRETNSPLKPTQRLITFAAFVIVLLLAGAELFSVGWGSGNWLGQLSSKWALALAGFTLGVLALAAGLYGLLWEQPRVIQWRAVLLSLTTRLNGLRWLLAALVAAVPAWLFAYSSLSLIFTGLFLRLLIFVIVIAVVAVLLSRSEESLLTWSSVLSAGVIAGAVFVLAEALTLVTNYPFALYWSEGNRIWDYSVGFGAERYNYSGPEPIFAWIDRGRQSLWGLPFLLDNASIALVRLWSAILFTLPYAILGWAVFRPLKEARWQWLLLGLWALLFLNQGPIYTPLVLSAILVALARRRPIWIALPFVFVAGYYAELSRFTWMFAPAMWAVMATLADPIDDKLGWKDWLKAAALAVAATWTGGIPFLIGNLRSLLPSDAPAVEIDPAAAAQGEVGINTIEGATAVIGNQDYIWDRLLPNATYAPGVLLALVLACLPLLLLLAYLVYTRRWKLNLWQVLAVAGPLGAFLVVGLIASSKVGGGTNLHNLDMFLIGMLFAAALAWEAGLYKHLASLANASAWNKALLLGIVMIPAFTPMIQARPLQLPTPDKVENALSAIQESVSCAAQHGEVLFMDQRQLLTFGFVENVPLLPEYEKKYVMDQALSANVSYFDEFYTRLEAHEFSLIVIDRQAIRFQNDGKLDVENNAWVQWVTVPLVEHYESIQNYKQVGVEMFAPIGRSYDCPTYGE